VDEQLVYHASLLDKVEDAVVAVDPEWLITGWNHGAERMYGWSIEEVLGKHVPSFVRMDLSEQQRAEARRELVERGCWRGDATVERKDGSMVWAEVINVAIRNKQGEVRGYLGIHRDITERRHAEDALREAQHRSETILESIGDQFFAVDGEWRLTYLNQRALANTRIARGKDLSLDDLLGRIFWDVLPELVGTRFDYELHRALREQQMVSFEIVGPLSGVWFEVRAYPTGDGLSVYSTDITERKRAEQRVVEAREVERSRIARALHDDALQGLADALALAMAARGASPEPGPARQLAPVLRRVGEQLRRAIYDLRLETKQHRPFPDLLEQLVEEQRALAVDCDIEFELGDGVATGSLGDALGVLRIVGEALTNARRHADARHVRVRVGGCERGARGHRGRRPLRARDHRQVGRRSSDGPLPSRRLPR
jgi:PAS domain S-box-containing protein